MELRSLDLLTYRFRSALAPGNLDIQSKYLAAKEYFNSLFFTDRPCHVIICHKTDIDTVSAIVNAKRGVTPHVYNNILSELDPESNEKATRTAFFFASLDQPFLPFIMVAATSNNLAYLYFRKFSMTIFGYKITPPIYDYLIDDEWQLGEIVTRTIYVTPPGDFTMDLLVGPRFQDIERFYLDKVERLSALLHTPCQLMQYRTKDTSFQKDLSVPDVFQSDKEYMLSMPDISVLLEFKDYSPLPVIRYDRYPRRFIVAPSGSGKTFYIKSHVWGPSETRFVDADTIFKFPSKNRWWEDSTLAREVDTNNSHILREWLLQKEDGSIIFYSDELGFKPDAYVIIPEKVLHANLSTNRPGQPGLSDFVRLVDSQKRIQLTARTQNIPVFTSFSEAVGHVTSGGRLQVARRNRSTWRYVCTVRKVHLPDFHLQDAVSVQTCWVKSITYALSRLLNFGSADMEVARRLALTEFNLPYTGHTRISGFYKNTSGRLVPIAISGHMVNYVILSCLIPLDFERLFDQLAWNIEVYSTKRKLSKKERFLLTNFYMAERTNLSNVYTLWHNVVEWILGYRAGMYFAVYLDLHFPDNFNAIERFFCGIGQKYPKAYDASLSTLDALKSGFTVRDWISVEAERQLGTWSVCSH